MTVLADRYELQELLGSGGMADVYAAIDRQLGRRVAIKLVRPHLVADGQSRQRLLREARAASFHHPNSVTVFDVGEDQRQPFIVMELVDGESLQDRLAREGRLPPAEAARIGAGVLAAVGAAHERGLVHRDIKPGNVLLPRRGGVKLADFGIAKAIAETAGDLTTPGDVMGTPKYLAPEQVAGKPTEPASDLYSLGVVLYECLTGAPLFTGDSPVAVAMAHQQRAVPPLRRAAPEVPAELARIVERALAKDPADRFADAASMRRALQAVADSGAIDAAGATPAARPATDPPAGQPPADGAPRGPAADRPRQRFGLGVLALVVALTVVGFLSVMLLRAESNGPGGAGDEPGGGTGPQEPGEPDSQPQSGSGGDEGDTPAADGQDGDASSHGSQDAGSAQDDASGGDQPADEPTSGDASTSGSGTQQPAASPTGSGAS